MFRPLGTRLWSRTALWSPRAGTAPREPGLARNSAPRGGHAQVPGSFHSAGGHSHGQASRVPCPLPRVPGPAWGGRHRRRRRAPHQPRTLTDGGAARHLRTATCAPPPRAAVRAAPPHLRAPLRAPSHLRCGGVGGARRLPPQAVLLLGGLVQQHPAAAQLPHARSGAGARACVRPVRPARSARKPGRRLLRGRDPARGRGRAETGGRGHTTLPGPDPPCAPPPAPDPPRVPTCTRNGVPAPTRPPAPVPDPAPQDPVPDPNPPPPIPGQAAPAPTRDPAPRPGPAPTGPPRRRPRPTASPPPPRPTPHPGVGCGPVPGLGAGGGALGLRSPRQRPRAARRASAHAHTGSGLGRRELETRPLEGTRTPQAGDSCVLGTRSTRAQGLGASVDDAGASGVRRCLRPGHAASLQTSRARARRSPCAEGPRPKPRGFWGLGGGTLGYGRLQVCRAPQNVQPAGASDARASATSARPK